MALLVRMLITSCGSRDSRMCASVAVLATVLQSLFSTLLQLDVRIQGLLWSMVCKSLHHSQQLVWLLHVGKSLACCALRFDCHRIAGPIFDARWQDISVHPLRRFWRLLAVCTTGVALLSLRVVQELMNLGELAHLAVLLSVGHGLAWSLAYLSECAYSLVVASTRKVERSAFGDLVFFLVLCS